jgi:hypothetical protein
MSEQDEDLEAWKRWNTKPGAQPMSEQARTVATAWDFDRFVPCPDCHRHCGWCSWYAKNARSAGCGHGVPNGLYRPSKRRCEWEQLKGETCPTCGGTEKMRLMGKYEQVEP